MRRLPIGRSAVLLPRGRRGVRAVPGRPVGGGWHRRRPSAEAWSAVVVVIDAVPRIAACDRCGCALRIGLWDHGTEVTLLPTVRHGWRFGPLPSERSPVAVSGGCADFAISGPLTPCAV